MLAIPYRFWLTDSVSALAARESRRGRSSLVSGPRREKMLLKKWNVGKVESGTRDTYCSPRHVNILQLQ